MRQSTHVGLALGLGWATWVASVVAEPPVTEAGQPKHVRRVGGEYGPPVELRLAADQGVRDARRAAWRGMRRGLRAPSELPLAIREELQKHGRRVARLLRIRTLTVALHDQAATQRVDQLIARELTRHREMLVRAWPAPPASDKPRVAPKDDDQDDDKPLEGEGEDEDEPGEGPP